jgi:beta-lactamase regulating signal transducer with metallopeptidase domain
MNLLYEIFTITVTGSIIFILFEGMQKISRRYFSAAWHYGILKCILLFFCIPIGRLINFLADHMFPKEVWLFHSTSGSNAEKAGVTYYIQKAGNYEISHLKVYGWLILIWILGVGILFIKQLISYIKFRGIIANNKIQASEYLQDIAGLCGMRQGIQQPIQLYINEYVNTPMLIGMLSPVIILPSDTLEVKNAEYVLSHELTHYKQKDLWIKVGMLVIRTIHWFNPFVYLLSKELDKWCEYTCDERNTVNLPMEMRKKYGLAILDAAADMPVYCSTFGAPFLSPKQNLKDRLLFMLSVKRMKRGTIAISFALEAALLSLGFLTAFAADTGKEAQLGYQQMEETVEEAVYETPANIQNITVDESLETDQPQRQQKYDAAFNSLQ